MEGENEWLKGMLRIIKQSAAAGGVDPGVSRPDGGGAVRKAGVGADEFAPKHEETPSESRDAAKGEEARRKGSPIGRAMRDSSI